VTRRAVDRLKCVDWRDLPPARVQPLYAAEAERWAATLEWETASNWAEVERGRHLRTVPGFVVTNDDGTVVGWSYYLIHRGALQVGSFVASSESAAEMMLDAILSDDARASVM